VAFGIAGLLLHGDHREAVCDALHQGCVRVHAASGFAIAAWVALLTALMASVIAVLRLARQRLRSAPSDGV
jgi:hypothetical protein